MPSYSAGPGPGATESTETARQTDSEETACTLLGLPGGLGALGTQGGATAFRL